MLYFKARRKNPTESPALTTSQRRIMKIMADAMSEVRKQVIRDEVAIADALRHATPYKVANLVSVDPWYQAQAKIEKELFDELVAAGQRAGDELPRITKATLSYRFDAERPDAAAWAAKEGAQLVTEITQDQQTMIQDYVSRSQMTEFTVTEVARNLRDVVGLTTQQSQWVDNYRNRAISERMAQGDSYQQAMERAAKPTEQYQARIHKYRTETIARTEILRASNEGKNQAWQQGIEEGYISPAARKQWVAEFDACEICSPWDGMDVAIGDDFPDGDPPLHPNCRCDTIMVDVDVTEYENMSWEEIDATLDELLGETTAAPAKNEPEIMQGDFEYGQGPAMKEFIEQFVDSDLNNGLADGDTMAAYRSYIGSGYEGMNGALRGYEEMTSRRANEIELLNNAINNARPTSSPALVYRGISSDVSGTIGDIHSDKGFMSTSVSREVAEDFSMGVTLYEIKVPAGAQAVQGMSHEGEIIFNVNSNLRITGIREEIGPMDEIMKIFEAEMVL